MTSIELQLLLNNLTSANNEAHKYRSILAEYCIRKYGYDPADVDFDEFIDLCDGGMGVSVGMSALAFIKGMENSREEAIKNRVLSE